jgi:phosphoribosylglycinamide formyltransferase-1
VESAFKVVVCASGGGGNFNSIVKEQSKKGYAVTKLIVDRDCPAITKSELYNIPVCRLNQGDRNESIELSFLKAIPSDTNLVVLAGFLSIVPKSICEMWNGKIINIHPSLLPKYGGKGMYGVKVQEAVMAAKEEFAGCTVHHVITEPDAGSIIAQSKIKVDYSQTPWELGGKIFELENKLLVEVISKFREVFLKK